MDILKRYLAAHEITQVAFAARVGVQQPTVSDWLSGRFRPSLNNLQAIAAETGLSLDALVGKRKKAPRVARVSSKVG